MQINLQKNLLFDKISHPQPCAKAIRGNASGPEGSRAPFIVLCRRCLGTFTKCSVCCYLFTNKKRDYIASFAFLTISENTSGSFIAKSASIFLSKSILAFLRAFINLE